MSLVDCRYCDDKHGDLLLCAPAKRVLDALYARGQRFDMPTVEFPEPVGGPGMFGAGTTLVAQVVVKAAIVDVAGACRPVLIFTGRDVGGGVLPEWVYGGTPDEIRRVVKLVGDTADMAIRRAREQNRRPS